MQFFGRNVIPELARGVSNSLLLWAQAPPPCPDCSPVVNCDCPAVEPTHVKEIFHERANPVEQAGLILGTFLAGLLAGIQLARGGFGSLWCHRRAVPAPAAGQPVPGAEDLHAEDEIAVLARRQQAQARRRVGTGI